MKLLLVEDDKKIAATVKRGLEAEGFTVEVAFDGNDGLWLASEGGYDLVVLDIMLPGRNGYRICADLRAAGNWTPILMLTAKDGELDEAEALDTGADDYLTKPFSYPVLVARVRTLVRRATGRNPAPWPSVTCASILANGGSGAAPMSAPSLHESSRCWSSWSAAPGRSCPRRRSWRECGIRTSMAIPTSSRFTSAACGVPSTSPTAGTPSRPCGEPATAWSMMPADHRARGGIGQVSGTVRFRVTALAVVAVAGVLLATGMVLVTAQRRLLTDNVEELIRQHADDLATIVTSGQVPAILTHTEGTLEQIVTPDGKVLAASPDLGAAPPLGPPPPGD